MRLLIVLVTLLMVGCLFESGDEVVETLVMEVIELEGREVYLLDGSLTAK